MENEQSTARIKNVLMMLAIMAAMYLSGNWLATQKAAADAGYNPVLGGFQIGSIHVYQPFAIRGWRKDAERLSARGAMAGYSHGQNSERIRIH